MDHAFDPTTDKVHGVNGTIDLSPPHTQVHGINGNMDLISQQTHIQGVNGTTIITSLVPRPRFSQHQIDYITIT